MQEVSELYTQLQEKVRRAAESLGAEKPASASPQDLTAENRYGNLPVIFVDIGQGAVFPKPIQPPQRYSWYEVYRRLGMHREHLRQFSTALEQAGANPARFPRLLSGWAQLSAELTTISQYIRYLKTWYDKPNLLADPLPMDSRADADWTELRERLKPRRVHQPAYLPSTLPSLLTHSAGYLQNRPLQTIPISIGTDVEDAHFLRDFGYAVDMHWNQSPWARAQRVRFEIRWRRIAKNRAFTEGREDLVAHLARLEAHPKPIVTTGALATYVRDEILVLGSGRITPRTLAHEFGHLLGFADCYVRTLAGEGIYGVAILEWDNPIYPDDLMCDDHVGVAYSEVW
ncbi:MAG: hypothetical protein AB7F66_05385 [Bacteriovoracia bacterium]